MHQARAFQTPFGTGYVLTDKQQNLLCVAAPGFGHSGWGAGCGAVGDVQRDGTGGLLSYSAADPHQVSVVDILPTGATATIREPGGQTRPLPLHDGVLAIIAPTPAQITTDIAGHATTIDIPPYQRPTERPQVSTSQVVERLHEWSARSKLGPRQGRDIGIVLWLRQLPG